MTWTATLLICAGLSFACGAAVFVIDAVSDMRHRNWLDRESRRRLGMDHTSVGNKGRDWR